MERQTWQLPVGTQDYLALECCNKTRLEEKMLALFSKSGYDRIQTPAFEYYDVFSAGIGWLKQEHMLKFFDSDGRILVLRPDMTMPLARVASSKLELPARLCYLADAYGCENAYYADQREFTQAGIELLGLAGDEADAEAIAIAIEALRAAGLEDFIIDIGQVDFFKGLMEEAGLSKEDSEQIREYVDQKNDVAVELFLKNRGVSESVKDKITRLSTLYGGAEVLEDAEKFSTHPRCRAAVDNIRRVHRILCDFGFEKYISIDFGMLQSIDYYTGVIFKGYSRELGFSLLSGGRYDSLLGRFGKDAPATGFALGIKRVLIALEKQGALLPQPGVDYVVGGDRRQGYAKLTQLRNNGSRAVSAFGLDERALEDYAKTLGARPIYAGGAL